MRRNFCCAFLNKSVPSDVPMHRKAALGWIKEVRSPGVVAVM